MSTRALSRGLGAGTLLALVLTFLGSVAGPQFAANPVPSAVVEAVTPSTPVTAIGSDAITTPIGTYSVRSDFVAVEVADGITVTARVRTPVGAPDGRAAVVFLHGAGTADYLGFPQQAHALASAGIVTVVPDKRMDTYSLQSRDYVASAADYHASVELAQSWPGVDPERVGIYAESEGAYIAPVLAVQYDDVAFVALVSAPVVPGRQQAAYAAATYLARTDVPDVVFRAIPRAMGAEFPLGWLGYADFDPQPYQQQMTQPLFIAYGTGDSSMPSAEATAQLIADLAVADNNQVTARFYEGANHGLKIGGIDGPLAGGFAADLVRWVDGLDGTSAAAPQVAGAIPNQVLSAAQGPSAPWYQSGLMLILPGLVSIGLLVVGGTSALVAGVRRGSLRPTPLGGRLLAASMLTLATWALYSHYVGRTASLAFGYGSDPGFTYGFLPLVQGVGAAAALALGTAGREWWDVRREPHRPFSTAATLMVGAGALGLLALAAYWGALPDPLGAPGLTAGL